MGRDTLQRCPLPDYQDADGQRHVIEQWLQLWQCPPQGRHVLDDQALLPWHEHTHRADGGRVLHAHLQRTPRCPHSLMCSWRHHQVDGLSTSRSPTPQLRAQGLGILQMGLREEVPTNHPCGCGTKARGFHSQGHQPSPFQAVVINPQLVVVRDTAPNLPALCAKSSYGLWLLQSPSLGSPGVRLLPAASLPVRWPIPMGGVHDAVAHPAAQGPGGSLPGPGNPKTAGGRS